MLRIATAALFLMWTVLPASSGTTVFRTQELGTTNQREAIIHIPDTALASKTPLPVLFVLHDQGETPAEIKYASHLLQAADRNGVIVVFPSGHTRAKAKGYYWSVPPFLESEEEPTPVEDDAFLKEILDRLDIQKVLDRDNVFIAGFAAGGSMAYQLGCLFPREYAGVISVAGTMTTQACAEGPSTSLLHLHGFDDTVMPYLGGKSASAASTSQPDIIWPDVMSGIRDWKSRQNCRVAKESAPNEDTLCTESRCSGDTLARTCLSFSSRHEWMGAKTYNEWKHRKGTETETSSLNATREIWDFIRRLTASKEPPSQASSDT